ELLRWFFRAHRGRRAGDLRVPRVLLPGVITRQHGWHGHSTGHRRHSSGRRVARVVRDRAAFTAINLVGVSQVAALQNTLTATKLAVIVLLLVLGFTAGSGDWAHFSMAT